MLSKIQSIWKSQRRQQLTDARSIGLYIFGIIVLAVTWSGVKTLQTNYELQRQISTLQQQNQVLYLKKQNTALQNQFYQSNEYLDLAARQDLGLAAPGEQVLLIPKAVSLKYVDQNLVDNVNSSITSGSADNRSRISKNLEAWRDFLLGRKSVGN